MNPACLPRAARAQRARSSSAGDGRTGLADVFLVWALLAVVGLEVFVTYTRTPIHELYHVRHGGVSEGLARTLAFVGFPYGLVVIAGLALVAQRLTRRAATIVTGASALVVAGILWPGALDEAGLGARPARILAAVGVALVVALAAVAARTGGIGPLGRERWDVRRLAFGLLLIFAALPWIAADLGFSLDRLPLLHALFQTDVLMRQPGQPGLYPAVHDGHHHGMDGVLLALAALFLSRTLRLIRSDTMRLATGFYLSLMLVYGLANAAQDFWLEQFVKRGWTTSQLPMMLVPSLRPAWAVIIGLSLTVFLTAVYVTADGQKIHRESKKRRAVVAAPTPAASR